MDSAHDPLAAVSASAPFPTIPAATSPRPRAARPRRHAAPFRSDHPASAATSSSRRYGSDVSRRPGPSSFVLQQGSPSVGSWGASGDANFVFGSGVVGASDTTKSLSSESGKGSLSAVDQLALDGSGWQSDTDASGSLPVVNVGDRLGTSGTGSNSSYSLDDQSELVDESSGVLSPTIRCQSVETRSLASQAVDGTPYTDGNISAKFAKSDDSLLARDSVDNGNFAKDGSKISAHVGDAQQNFFVFGEHAGYRQFTANADQPDVNKVDSAGNAVTYMSEQLNDSSAKYSTYRKFILQDAEHAFGSSNKDSPHTEPQEISAALNASNAVPSSLGYEDACAKVSFNDSTLKTTESSHDGTEFMSSAKMEQPDQSGFTFSASTFDQNTLPSQRRHNKKKVGGMGTHANFIQSCPTSIGIQSRPASIGIACSVVSTSQQCMDLAAQWTDNRKMQPTETDKFGHHGDCEAWRLRGNQAFAEGQLTKAEECYTHGIDSFSPTEASRKALMLCYSNRAAARMSLGKMREALSDCREAIDIDSCFLKAQVRAANCLLALGDVEEAQKVFEMCLKSNHLSNSDHKIVEEASDGLQKVQKLSGFILQSKEHLVTKAFDKIPSALQMISDALSISIYSDSLMVMKAEALLLLRRYEEVIQFCQETLYLAERNSICFFPDKHSESNLDTICCSVKLWRYHLVAKSYFFLGKLEEAQQFLKKCEQTKIKECRCGKQSQQSISSFSMAISELLQLKAAGNEAFQAGKYSVAVEHYTTALLSNTESLHFSTICLCNRAAAYQAMGQILDAIADCSLAIALDAGYSKAISRRSSLYELLRDYDQAANDLRRLISLLEKQLQENMSMPSDKAESIRSNLNRANLRLASLERDARKGARLNLYLILGIEPSCSAVDIKKAYRKAALRHHPDKAGKSLVRSENISDALWREITNEIRRDADYLFKLIGKAYAMLSDPTMKSN